MPRRKATPAAAAETAVPAGDSDTTQQSTPEPKAKAKKYSPEDIAKLDQFAIGLLSADTHVNLDPEVLKLRVDLAYQHAEILLAKSKALSDLEA